MKSYVYKLLIQMKVFLDNWKMKKNTEEETQKAMQKKFGSSFCIFFFFFFLENYRNKQN